MTKLFYVNSKKKARAEEILALVSGVIIPKSNDQQIKKDKFGAFMAEASIDPKSEDALPFVYEKLGGLLRTEDEQKAADLRKKEIQAKAKKKMIE